MGKKIRKIGRKRKNSRKPKGLFIQDYHTFSISHNIVFDSEFNGIPQAELTLLKSPGRIQMTQKAWTSHVNRTQHIHSFEEISEVLNDPDLILHQRKKFGKSNVQFILKDIENEKPRLVVVFINDDNVHYIGTAYYIERSKIKSYLQKHIIVYQR